MKILFSKFKKGERILFLATLSFIAAVGLYILILEPVYNKWDQLSVELESANVKLFKNLKLLAEKESLQREYEKYKDYIQPKESGDEEMASVLKEIETMALGSGVRITSIKPIGSKQFKNYKKFNVELISEGKISQFLKFIYDLESSKRLLKVERLVLSLKGTQSDLLKGTLIIHKISF